MPRIGMIVKRLNPGNHRYSERCTLPIMTRICVVKQHTTYDLFTRTGPDLAAIVASSNWRSGPIGLWEAFDASARIVFDDPSRECRLGERQWGRYVQGWELWPADGTADHAEAVDWGQYDIVISIDVAVPTRIVKRFPQVMWCYYFIEGGPFGIDDQFRGSPFFGYNVFFNHRLAKDRLTPESPSVRKMKNNRRAVLDFPYYMQSARSVRNLYPELANAPRSGICLSHHSRGVMSDLDLAALTQAGPVRTEWKTIADIHRAELQSRYFVVHPACRPMAGLALIEAISAGCLALAPASGVWGFPELLVDSLAYSSMGELIAILSKLETDCGLYSESLEAQQHRVDEWCYRNPAHNLATALQAFRSTPPAPRRQRRSEIRSGIAAVCSRAARRALRRARSIIRRTRTQLATEAGR